MSAIPLIVVKIGQHDHNKLEIYVHYKYLHRPVLKYHKYGGTKVKIVGIFVMAVLGSMQLSQAALNNIGGGLVNDTSLNVTWLQDANMVKTLCSANDPLWQSWPEPARAVANNSGRTKVQICTDSAAIPFTGGLLNWYEAENWIAHLNDNNYLGYNDWRQPSTFQADTSCEFIIVLGQYAGFNCRESELGHLFNTSLVNPNDSGTGISIDPAKNGPVGTNCFANAFGPAPADCFQNTAPFSNAHSYVYWSGSSYAPNTASAWFFSTTTGKQDIIFKDPVNVYVWPVRSGLSAVAASQPIPALSVWGLGIMALLLLVSFLGLESKQACFDSKPKIQA